MSQPIKFDHRFLERFPYVIVDAAYRDEMPDSWAARPIAPAFLGRDTARCPVLIDTNVLPQAEHSSLMDRIEAETRAGQECLVSLALAASITEAGLLKHLQSRIQVIDPQDGQPRQFRYFDPGTFIQLPDILGAAGMAWLLGPIQTLAVPWLGEWCCYDRHDAPIAADFDLRAHWERLTSAVSERGVTRHCRQGSIFNGHECNTNLKRAMILSYLLCMLGNGIPSSTAIQLSDAFSLSWLMLRPTMSSTIAN